MASSQRAYRNPESSDSENSSRVHWKAFFALVDESTLHPSLAVTLKSLMRAAGMGPMLWPATKKVAGFAGVCYRTAQRHIDELERRHLLKKKHEANEFVAGYGFRHTATYVVHPEAKQKLSRCRRMTNADWDRLKKTDPHPEPPKTERRIYFLPMRGLKAHNQSQIRSAPAVNGAHTVDEISAPPAVPSSPPESPPESPPKVAGKLTRDEKNAIHRRVLELVLPMKKDSQFLPPVLEEANALSRWFGVLSVLETKIDPHSFQTWLKPTHGSYSSDGVLYVRVPTPELRHGETKYADMIAAAIAHLKFPYRRVKFFAVSAEAKEIPAMTIQAAVAKACKELSTPRRVISVEDGIVALRLKGMNVEEGGA